MESDESSLSDVDSTDLFDIDDTFVTAHETTQTYTPVDDDDDENTDHQPITFLKKINWKNCLSPSSVPHSVPNLNPTSGFCSFNDDVNVQSMTQTPKRKLSASKRSKEKEVSTTKPTEQFPGLNHDDDDINEDVIESSIAIALQDPITKSRMLTPVRSIKCSHIDSFDLDNFLILNNLSKIKVRSKRIKTDLKALRNSQKNLLAERLNPYVGSGIVGSKKGKHEFVNKEPYLLAKLENKIMKRQNNNLKYFTCPICDQEFDLFNDLYIVDFLQEIIVELNNMMMVDKDGPKEFIDKFTNRKHNYSEVTHVMMNRDGTYEFHVRDNYQKDLDNHELVELPDDDDDDEIGSSNKNVVVSIRADLNVTPKKKRKITIELSDTESWSEGFEVESILNDDDGYDESNPICIDD